MPEKQKEKREQTIFITFSSLSIGYGLVWLSAVLGKSFQIIYFLQNYDELKNICLWNFAIAGLGGCILLYRRFIKNSSSDNDSWGTLWYMVYIIICSSSSIISLYNIIHLTGGAFFSPYTGFYSMLFSIFMFCLYKWATNRILPIIALLLYFAASSYSIWFSFINDPTDLTLNYSVTLNKNESKAIFNAINDSKNKLKRNIKYDSSGFLSLSISCLEDNFATEKENLFLELKEKKLSSKDVRAVENVFDRFIDDTLQIGGPEYNFNNRIIKISIIIAGIFFAAVIGVIDRWNKEKE